MKGLKTHIVKNVWVEWFHTDLQLGAEGGAPGQPGVRMAQSQAPGGSLMSNGLPVLRQHTNRDAYTQPLMNVRPLDSCSTIVL